METAAAFYDLTQNPGIFALKCGQTQAKSPGNFAY